MKRYISLRTLSGCLLILFTVIAYGQTPTDSIPTSGQDDEDIPGTINPTEPFKPFIPDLISVPLVPFVPSPEVEPAIPLEPFFPTDPNKVPTVNPDKPPIPSVDNKYHVGSTSGSLTVNGLGAAQYNIPISIPHGGTLMPEIALSYNSQNATNGIAGYGISLTGFSSITRGEKTIFNNKGKIAGVTYTESDNLFLDGKRMILTSGSACQEGAVYYLEGDPFTTITAHGTYSTSSTTTWFEVVTSDGKRYEYGHTNDSRITFKNKSGLSRIASWQLNKVKDLQDNYMTFEYSVVDYYPYPYRISYGLNSQKDRGIVNRVEVSYESLGASQSYFVLEDTKHYINRRIATITSYTEEHVFRKYNLTYDVASDKTLCKYARLTSIREENGSGESLTPTTLNWEYLPGNEVERLRINDPTYSYDPNVKIIDGNRNYFAADVTGDGISDIIRISPIEETQSTGKINSYTAVYISRSSVSDKGKVSYTAPLIVKLSPSIKFIDPEVGLTMGGSQLADVDGDGINDLLFIQQMPYNNTWNNEHCSVIYGKDIVQGKVKVSGYNFSVHPTSEQCLFTTCDFNKDGKDEIMCLEKVLYNGKYRATIAKDNGAEDSYLQEYYFTISQKPERLFCGDFNNDGLNDFIVFHSGGYKIFYNLGEEVIDSRFSDAVSDCKSGTNFGNNWRMAQGDFNGDGLSDFVYNVSGETYLWIALNNGDGTFTLSKSDDIGVADTPDELDDNYYSLHVLDINRDGRSDIMVCKADLEKKFGFNVYKDSKIKWLYSNGSALKLQKNYTATRYENAYTGYIFVGDFDGDGNIDLANYGSSLDRIDNDFTENTLNIYKTKSGTANTGRITSITDGMGNKSDISYSYLTTPEVYEKTRSMGEIYRVNTVTIPLPVVKRLSFTNGICGSDVINYTYRDLMVHMAGVGVLGFSENTKINESTGESKTTTVEWNKTRWIPEKTKEVSSVGDHTSSVETTYDFYTLGPTYYTVDWYEDMTDMYGNNISTINSYDRNKGVLTSRIVRNDGEKMYKKVTYSDYEQYSGVWRPKSMTLTQKHEHDSSPYSTETRYEYNSKGNITSTTVNYGTDMALTTTNTYDEYGNCISSYSTGKSVNKIIKYNEYDSSGRFVVKSYQSPEGIVNTFTYDIWGNLLTETDLTNTSSPLTTSHTYNDWGERISSLAPDATKVTFQTGWGKTRNKHHYSFTSQSGQPWVITWYDKAGNETGRQTFGPMNVLIGQSFEYDKNGLIKKVNKQNGKLSVWESKSYDELGRVINEKNSSGKETVYSYNNRSVTISSDGRSSTKTSDAWGNTLTSTDPNGTKVTYTYGSNGQPSVITTSGNKVTMTYDAAGNKVSVSDPDAGNTSAEYAADGKLIEQIDAKGVKTTYTYDKLGRLTNVKTGSKLITNVYGISGNEKMRLVRKTLGRNMITYTHDKYGRITNEYRTIEDKGNYTFTYTYDAHNRLSSISYPNGDNISYGYNDYGIRVSTSVNGTLVRQLKSYTGLETTSTFLDNITLTQQMDEKGYERSREAILGEKTLDRIELEFDTLTDNLLARTRLGYQKESFEYDNLDRLISVRKNNIELMNLSYALNGNILSKTGIGEYSYNASIQPHAVVSVSNPSSVIPSETLLTNFNEYGLISSIEDTEQGLSMNFLYGPEMLRWKSFLRKPDNNTREITYLNNLELRVENGTPLHYLYVDDNLLYIRSSEGMIPYFVFRDHQGSVMSAFKKNGTKVFEASYDAWGKQTVSLNEIGLIRGYTGHEMLNEFGIINMNGRLYDPDLGRFLSPDPFIQFPDFSQSYNRYSYCLNNPLKYTDPSGQLATGLASIIGISIFQIVKGMLHAHATGGNVIKAGIISLLSSSLCSYGIGELYGSTGAVGKELLRAGTHGLASGLAGMLEGGNFGSFASGFMTGMASSAMAQNTMREIAQLGPNDDIGPLVDKLQWQSALVGGMMAFVTGGRFLQGAFIGLNISAFNHGMHITGYTMINGQKYAQLEEVEIYPETMLNKAQHLLTRTGDFNTAIGSFAQSLKDYSGNSTIGTNGKLYWKFDNQRPFNGNQYVKTYGLKNIGAKIYSTTNPATGIIGVSQILVGAGMDYEVYQATGIVRIDNTFRSSMTFLGGYFGAEAGIQAGAYIGAGIGSLFGGIGAIPGAIIGGAIGGFLGGWGGSVVADRMVDYYYE